MITMIEIGQVIQTIDKALTSTISVIVHEIIGGLIGGYIYGHPIYRGLIGCGLVALIIGWVATMREDRGR